MRSIGIMRMNRARKNGKHTGIGTRQMDTNVHSKRSQNWTTKLNKIGIEATSRAGKYEEEIEK